MNGSKGMLLTRSLFSKNLLHLKTHQTSRRKICYTGRGIGVEKGAQKAFSSLQAMDPNYEHMNLQITPFRLSSEFVASYKEKVPPFGFNGLGELVYLRTYSRFKSDGYKEQWHETIERVVNGTFSLQKNWFINNGITYNEKEMNITAQGMYDRIFEMKFLPPGRGLWAMGSPITEERKLYAALNNCGFVSTKNIKEDPSKPFTFLMDASMLGVGVGFDTKGAGTITVQGAKVYNDEPVFYQIGDTREAWVESVGTLINAEVNGLRKPKFDYSLIRKAGEPIRGFGGTSQGYEILEELHESISKILIPLQGKLLSVTAIVDIMNLIGKCVVAGNVRRTAEIAFGEPDDEEYIALKDFEKNPQRVDYAWTSNNSVFARLGMNYDQICEKVKINGEPGFAWLDNMQAFGRMKDPPNWKDRNAMGGNPCLEQTLESHELCCLVETFPNKHENLAEYLDTLQYAFLYSKIVTLGETHWADTNKVMSKNRRIGCSMSGLAQFIAARGLDELREWCDQGYNKIQSIDTELSKKMNIPNSIKTTSIKPSGTVSLLAGATPGMHYPESRFYIRRVRISKTSDLLDALKKGGYKIEDCFGDEKNTAVVEFPIDAGENVRTQNDVSMFEQLCLAAFLQKYWADNQVSCTITFDPKKNEDKDISHALDFFQYQLKGVSFLPKLELGAYKQMPYEEITQEEYLKSMTEIQNTQTQFFNRHKNMKSLFDGYQKIPELNRIEQAPPDKFCEACAIIEDDDNETKQ